MHELMLAVLVGAAADELCAAAAPRRARSVKTAFIVASLSERGVGERERGGARQSE